MKVGPFILLRAFDKNFLLTIFSGQHEFVVLKTITL